ncbi:hypothetical protein SDC9_200669 [bioreactor metagenome]|uniref:Uncharacterized protein n=1 Tax=bioreactor metagenome TaxID=1076179 RepID=A0A645IPL0_9ZZZZ
MNVQQSLWRDQKRASIVEQMKPFYLSWAKEHLKNYDAISHFIYFCLSDVGSILIPEGIIIISDTLNNDEPRIGDDVPELLARFCSKIWKDYGVSLDNDKNFEHAFFNILSTAVSYNSQSAQELYQCIAQQRQGQ